MTNFLSAPLPGTQPGDVITITDGAPLILESAWVDYPAQLMNVVLGTNGFVRARKRQVGGDFEIKVVVMLGTGGSMGDFPSIALPCVAEPLAHKYMGYGHASLYWAGNPDWAYPGVVNANGDSRERARFYSTLAGAFANIGPAAPVNWSAAPAGSVLAARFWVTPA